MSDWDKFSYQEFFIGALAASPSIYFIGWQGIFLSIACGILWMMGGTYKTAIRRFCVPASIYIMATGILGFHWYYLIGLAVGIGILHIGDGFPDRRPSTEDEGSWLGRQVEKVFPQDNVGGLITKLIIPVLFQLSLIPYYF